MKSISYNSSLLIAFCFCIIVWIAIQSAFFQFLHYDSQYRLLDPDHYNVEVITEEDHNYQIPKIEQLCCRMGLQK
jgi:hypothetical protein